MHRVSVGLGAVLLSLTACAGTEPDGPAATREVVAPAPSYLVPSNGWTQTIQSRIRSSEYAIREREDLFTATNRAHGLRGRWDDRELTVEGRTDPGTPIAIRIARWGRSGEMVPAAPATPAFGGCQSDRAVDADGQCLRRLEASRGDLLEWWENRPDGIEHGMVVHDPVGGATREPRPLRVILAVAGARVALDGQRAARLEAPGAPALQYGGLRAYDAGGTELSARFEPWPGGLAIAVEDRGAAYPITIDPLLASAAWSVEPNQAGADLGFSVAPAGDVDGDGYGDIIVGAPYYDNGEGNEGRAFLYRGTASGLAAGPAWTAESNQADAAFGTAVAGAGDVDGDGYGDVIVGAPYYDTPVVDAGQVYVFFGSAGGLAASAGWTNGSNQSSTLFGSAVASAGDVDGDGYGDIIIGGHQYSNGEGLEGVAWVYRGSSSGVSGSGVWVTEGGLADAHLGYSVASAGDVNGDGYGDVIVGARQYSNGESAEGRALVYHGSASGLAASPAWTGEPNQDNAYFGTAVAGAGDVDGDGFGDVIVGAPQYDNGQAGEGRAYLYYGSAAGIQTYGAWTAEADLASATFGSAVASAGDVNGDGFADVLVGAPSYANGQANEGRAFLYLGASDGLAASPAWTAENDLTGSGLGTSVAGAGDVDGDGFADAVVGAPYYGNGQGSEGCAYAFHGTADGLATSAAWSDESDWSDAYLGSAVATGDVNGDGFADLIVGSPGYANGQSNEGRVELYLGSGGGFASGPTWSVESDNTNAKLGTSVAFAGDVDGDGYGDVIVGAPGYTNGQSTEGRAYVFHGTGSGLESSPSWGFEADLASAELGRSVGAAGDVNGDGFADVVVGAPGYTNGETGEGRAYLFLGSATDLATSPAWTVESDRVTTELGAAVAGAGDVDGDGFADVIVGAPGYTNGTVQEGQARLYLGTTSGLAATPSWSYESNATAAGARFGDTVAAAGDVNGDGRGDVLVGAPSFTNGSTNEGRVNLFLGSSGGNMTGSWYKEGDLGNAALGGSLAAAGDVDGDGYDDVILGAPGWNNGESGEGRAFLIRGAASPSATVAWQTAETDAVGMSVGSSVAATDLDGDGFGDVIIGASGYTNGESNEGIVFAYYGGDEAPGLPRQLGQYQDDNTTAIPVGGASANANVVFSGLVTQEGFAGGKLYLEVEAKPVGTPFDGTGSVLSSPTIAGNPAAVAMAGLTSGPYHWRARVVYPVGTGHGRWIAFGGNGEAMQDFRILLANGETCTYGPRCQSHECVDEVCCDTPCGGGDTTDCQACSMDFGASGDGVCETLTGYVCRPSADLCDAEEVCDGASTGCPPDALEPDTTECRSALGVCDVAEFCTGSSAACPANGFVPDTTECRGSNGVCDVAEFCTGAWAFCPSDLFRTSAYRCRDVAGDCDVAEFCTGSSAACPADSFLPDTTECRAVNGLCDVAEFCTGSAADCPADGFLPDTTECRGIAGDCDVAEFCTGSSKNCPTDLFLPDTTECRGVFGTCDVAENCTGSSATCPPNLFLPDTTECRAANGDCDVAENCTGSDKDCPVDGFLPDTTECRGANGVCDAAENCTGSSKDCPADGFLPDTTECRGSSGDCDVAENCTGSAADCPADGFLPDTTECRGSSGDCDVAENCTGSSKDCPTDSFLPDTTECRGVNGDCDVAENCTGSSAACPTDAFKPDTQECRPLTGDCDVAENCTGSSKDCPTDTFLPDTSVCRDATDLCDAAEHCTGSSNACPVDVLEPDTKVCRDVAGNCDVAENCTGSSAACPTDLFLPDTTECRGSGGDCDVAENCTGASATCPTDAFKPDTQECRPLNGDCDVAENCTGASADCPTDGFLPDTTECRGSTGLCDAAENCTGASADCPADVLEPDTTVCRVKDGDCDVAEYCTGASKDCPGDSVEPDTTECRGLAGLCDIAEFCNGSAKTCPADTFLDATATCRDSTDACDPAELCPGAGPECPADVDTDPDDDTVCAADDNCPDDANPSQTDTDGDLIGDACDDDDDGDYLLDTDEALAGTDPLDPDSDGDNILDSEEVGDNPSVPTNTDGAGSIDAWDLDSDDDGASDLLEAGDDDLFTPAVDTDHDTTPDFQDLDSDEDGVNDANDNCRLVYNPDQDDACTGDIDGDGVADGDDNCRYIANTGQADNDEDDRGDVCDSDDDNDGVLDDDDNCPYDYNPGQEDDDDNGVGNACDGETPDAGVPDAGIPDAGAGADASANLDASADADAREPDTGRQSAYSCRVGASPGRGGASPPVVLGLLLGALWFRRRRRRGKPSETRRDVTGEAP